MWAVLVEEMVRTISRGKDPALQQLYTLCIGCSRTFCAIWCRGSHVVKYKGFITACTLFIYLFFLCESKYMQPQSLYTLLYPTFSFFFFLLYIAFGHAFSCENTSHIYSMKLGSHSDCTLTVYPDTADGNDVKY